MPTPEATSSPDRLHALRARFGWRSIDARAIAKSREGRRFALILLAWCAYQAFTFGRAALVTLPLTFLFVYAFLPRRPNQVNPA